MPSTEAVDLPNMSLRTLCGELSGAMARRPELALYSGIGRKAGMAFRIA